MIDTAHVYSGGDSERAIGGALRRTPRGRGRDEGRLPRRAAARRRFARRSRRASAPADRHHRPLLPAPRRSGDAAGGEPRGDRGVPRRGEGSGTSASPRSAWNRSSAAREVVPIAAVQNHYNLARARSRRRRRPLRSEGIVFVPYFPLQGGGLAALAEVAAAPRRVAASRSRSPGCCGARRDPADPGHALDRAPAGEPRGARDRAHRRGVRGALLAGLARLDDLQERHLVVLHRCRLPRSRDFLAKARRLAFARLHRLLVLP